MSENIFYVVIKQSNDVIVKPMTKLDWTAMALTGKGLGEGESIIEKYTDESAANGTRDFIYNLHFGNKKE